jgi:hypothetical protein
VLEWRHARTFNLVQLLLEKPQHLQAVWPHVLHFLEHCLRLSPRRAGSAS